MIEPTNRRTNLVDPTLGGRDERRTVIATPRSNATFSGWGPRF